VPFVVAGTSGQVSQRDKDAVIEILERRPDGIVLGRKSLMVTTAAPIAATSPRVEIFLNLGGTIDDYVAWRPVRAQLRQIPGPGPAADMAVTVRNMSAITGGALAFGPSPALTENVQPPAMAPTLGLTLPGDGSSVAFFVAGDFGKPSANDKDAVLEVVRASDGLVLGREGLMVRIRKNGNNLTANERDRLLYAIARLNNVGLNNYVVYQQIHAVAGSPLYPGHSGPAFLAWHRPYILRYERELQAIDPGVALSYWRFDQPAPAVFSASFMGGPPGPGGNVTFTASNPLSTWSIEGLSGIPRSPNFSPTQTPTLRTETQTLALGGTGANYASFASMEGNPHGSSHTAAGGGGWVGSVPTAVRDPLFFLLHSNVERLWAKWQWIYLRQDPSAAASYAPQGAYAGGGTVRLGHYAQDSMWPWDGRTGFVTPGDPLTQRPSTAPGGALPAAIGGWGPPIRPSPVDVIDYDRWVLLSPSGLAYGYDDVPFLF
jgi:tyrosinase